MTSKVSLECLLSGNIEPHIEVINNREGILKKAEAKSYNLCSILLIGRGCYSFHFFLLQNNSPGPTKLIKP